MPPNGSTRKFRVALSFPGEHRDRYVEPIAQELANHFEKSEILYDRWHSADFARPNLDTWLARLYRDESDLIVVFLCREYTAKQWCGLEFR